MGAFIPDDFPGCHRQGPGRRNHGNKKKAIFAGAS